MVYERYSKEIVCGLPILIWLELFRGCYEMTYGGIYRRICFPDNRPLIHQPYILIYLFSIIKKTKEEIWLKNYKS